VSEQSLKPHPTQYRSYRRRVIWSATFSEFCNWCNYICIIWNVPAVEIDHSQQTSTCFLCFWSVTVQNSTNSFCLWSNCTPLMVVPKKFYFSKANFTFARLQVAFRTLSKKSLNISMCFCQSLVHCVQKKKPTLVFCYISLENV